MTGPGARLQEALTREHREVDAAVEAFVGDLARGVVDASRLRPALVALRRHIYLEEEVVFPPVQRAGLVMPVLVMLREHGELWRTMDRLEGLLDDLARPSAGTGGDETTGEAADSGSRDELVATCRGLLVALERHNGKEEPIVYPHVSSDLSAAEQAVLSDLMASGATPDGWTCQRASG